MKERVARRELNESALEVSVCGTNNGNNNFFQFNTLQKLR